jgi:branched-chain amino acid transport system substrate-binding protein
VFTTAWYWDMTDANRKFAKEVADQNRGLYPSMLQAGVYASVIHYLKAVQALGEDGDGKKVVDKMKELPTDDPLFGKGTIRVDGRQLHDMYLMEVKKPSDSKYPWDYYKLRATIPADQAFRPLSESACPLVKKG